MLRLARLLFLKFIVAQQRKIFEESSNRRMRNSNPSKDKERTINEERMRFIGTWSEYTSSGGQTQKTRSSAKGISLSLTLFSIGVPQFHATVPQFHTVSIVSFFIRCLLSLKPHSNQNHRISTLKQQMKSPPYGLNYAFDHAGRKVLTYFDQKMPFNTHSNADRFSYMGSSIPRLQK